VRQHQLHSKNILVKYISLLSASAILFSNDGFTHDICSLNLHATPFDLGSAVKKTRFRYYPRAPTASAWTARVVFIPSSLFGELSLNAHIIMVELLKLRV
jgi:hypothetical protein